MKGISTVMSKAILVFKHIAGVLAFFSTLLSTAGAIFRYVFKAPIVWGDELCVYAVILMVFVCLPGLEWEDNQLNISAILSVVKSQAGRTALIYIRGVITMLFNGVLAYFGFVMAQRTISRAVLTPVLRFPKGIPYYFVAICFAISVIVWIIIMLRKGKYGNAD